MHLNLFVDAPGFNNNKKTTPPIKQENKNY